MQHAPFRFILPARLEYREPIGSFLTSLCHALEKSHGLSETAGHHVVSAFAEAFNNACLHASEDTEASLEVDLEILTDRLRMTIRNPGPGFDLESIPEPDLDALPEGGMGLFIIRRFMDVVKAEHEAGWNVLVLEKRLDGE